MECKVCCDSELKDIAIGFSVILSSKKYRSVTVFCGNLKDIKRRIRLTRAVYKRGSGDARYGAVIVSIGRPNYREREYIKVCKKAKKSPEKYWINRVIL